MRQITITIPGKIHPSQNKLRGMHWAPLSKLKREWEEEIFWLVKAQGWRVPLKRALVVISYFAGDKRRRDQDNHSPKFILDGLVKASVIEDDNTKAVEVQWTLFEQGPRRTVINVMEV